MNVLCALLIVMLFGAFAGLMHGIIVYGGLLLPQHLESKKVPQDDGTTVVYSMIIPGAFGHAAVGATSGLVVFSSMHLELVIGWSAQYTPTLGDILAATLLGLGGSAGLNLWLDQKDLLGIKQPAPPSNGNNPPPTADSNASGPNQPTSVVAPPTIKIEVIKTPKGGVCTNHSFDLYKALLSA